MTVLDRVIIEGKEVELDTEGYLAHYDDWTDSVARFLAQKEGIGPLSAEKMEMLKYIRWFYKKYDYFPIVNSVCKNVHLPKNCVQEGFLNPLIAWKLAGLPRPEEPIISLLEAGQSPG